MRVPGDVRAAAERLGARIAARRARVCVVGLGYVGLPLARAFLDAGFPVLGYDSDAQKIRALTEGRSYMAQLPDEVIAGMRGTGRFDVTPDSAVFATADVIVICVPTPLAPGREPDLSYVVATADAIAQHLREGQLVVLESTTYPGTTDEVLRPILEQSGLEAERDFFLAYSPEREDPGNARFTTRSIPRVVGGVGPRSHDIACALYGAVVERVVPVRDCRVAEASKILENTYRAVNIALVNELKVLFGRMGIDVWDVIEAAKSKPFGYEAFYPGPGLGGHCIPIDPFYLSWLARRQGMETQFIELAGRVNTEMPGYVVGRIAEALNAARRAVRGSRVLILGLSYKADIDDTRESPAFPIMQELHRMGAEVTWHDPFFEQMPEKREFDLAIERSSLTAAVLGAQDCTVIVTDHSCIDYAWVVEHSQCVVDTRGATRALGPLPKILHA